MKILPVLLLLIAVVGQAFADLKSDINASNKKLDRAMKAKDIKTVEAIMKANVTSDYKFFEGGRSQDFKTFIGNMTGSIVMMETITAVSSRVISVKVAGDKATAKEEHTITGTMKTPDKKSHTTSWSGVFADDYRKVGGQWKNFKTTALSQSYLMDGKPAKM